MANLSSSAVIGVLGAGTMGSGIAQVAATAGHKTLLFDTNPDMLRKSEEDLQKTLDKLVEKGKLKQEAARHIRDNISYVGSLEEFSPCTLIIEAILEDLPIKQQVFGQLESIVAPDAVLASNTSSLSITSIAGSCKLPQRVLGIHFFNPAPLMPLVEIIPGLSTENSLLESVKRLIEAWGKSAVIVKDTPGFIVNRVARSYYGESIKIHEEGWLGVPEGAAGFATIDWALKEYGGFRMGPFELMDMIGNDINYTVTETVWKQFFYDPKFKPSLTQKRLVEARRFGRKSGQGYYSYAPGAALAEPLKDEVLGKKIADRVTAMLINEAVDALYLRVASRDDLDLAMTKGVNYPKGLLRWCDELGASKVLSTLNELYSTYQEERYRASVLLKRMAAEGKKFY